MTRIPTPAAGLAGTASATAAATTARADHSDPFDSGMWDFHRAEHLGDPTDWRFDPDVRLISPGEADDARHLPLMLDATRVEGVERIVVTADYSPFPWVMTFTPGRAVARLGFGMKIDQGTAVRVSALGTDGTWRIGGAFIRAAGGGCGVPAKAHERPDWQSTLGQTRARLWPDGRLRLRITHPMDTGLADGAPQFFLTEIAVADLDGAPFADLEIGVPLEEDPSLALDLPPEMARAGVRVTARDNMGLVIDHLVPGAA
ncbi:MAG: quinoprotein dehydrogenase-associated SoxYZ-like carrier [Pseudomonadota bacterium]